MFLASLSAPRSNSKISAFKSRLSAARCNGVLPFCARAAKAQKPHSRQGTRQHRRRRAPSPRRTAACCKHGCKGNVDRDARCFSPPCLRRDPAAKSQWTPCASSALRHGAAPSCRPACAPCRQPQQRDSRRVSAFQRRAQRSGRQGRAAQPKPRYARSRRAPPPRTAAYCEHVAVRGFGASWATHPVSRLQVCAAVQQQSHHGRVAAHGGHLKRRPAKLRTPRAARARRQPARTRFQLHNATAAGAGSAQSPCTLCLRLRPAPRAPPPRRRSSPILASLYFPPWLRVRRCARGSDAAQRWLGASGSSSGACAGAALHGGAPNGARVGYM